MYFFPQPPYFLVFAGLFIGITCGLSFQAVLKDNVNRWSKNRSSRILAEFQSLKLLLPFMGICVGICVFLASGFEIFTFNRSLGYLIALPMTVLTGWLCWSQLMNLLLQIEQGGSKALDLDSFNF